MIALGFIDAILLFPTMDRPIIETHKPWIRVGDGLTLVGMAIGFITVFVTHGSDINELKVSMVEVKSSLRSIENSQNDNRVLMKDLADRVDTLNSRTDRTDKHLEANDSRVNALESLAKVLDTNQQLMNQQLQYIGTSHVVPSTKK